VRERYADLLGPDIANPDPALAHLVADLDALHSAAEPPAALLSMFDTGALSERASRRHGVRLSVVALARPAERHSQGATFMPARRRISAIAGSLAVVLVVGLMAALLISMSHGGGPGSGNPHETPAQRFARLGGTKIVLQAQACPGSTSYATDCYVQAEQARMVAAEQQRASTFLNIHDAIVQALPNDQILIELPGYAASKPDIRAFVTTSPVAVVETGAIVPQGTDIFSKVCTPGVYCPAGSWPIVFTGDQLDRSSISAGYDTNSGKPIVTFAFAGAARDQFATYTRKHIGQPLTITLDDVVVVSATIQSEIDGNGQVTNLTSIQQAQSLAAELKAGPLPLTATIVSSAIVPAAGSCATATPGPTGTATATATAMPYPTGTATPTPSAGALRPPLFSGGPTPTPTTAPGPTPPPTATSGSTGGATPTPPPTATPAPFDGTPSPTAFDPCSTPTVIPPPGPFDGTPTPTATPAG
jgi:hypothetical protein